MHPIEALLYYSGLVFYTFIIFIICFFFNYFFCYLIKKKLILAALFPCYIGAHPFVSVAYIIDGALQGRF